MAEFFVSKSTVPLEDCLPFGATTLLDSYANLQDVLVARLGAEAADLFAEPFVSRDKSGKQITIAWHSVHPGTDQALADSDPALRRGVEDRLHRLIPRIEGLAADPSLAPMIRAALSLSGPKDIRVINGVPVLVNWGMRNRAPTEALAAYMRGDATASSAPLAAAGVAATAAAMAPTATDAASAAPPAAAVPPPAYAPPPSDAAASRLHPAAWVPLAVLLGLAVATLVWLLLPGTRIFPAVALIDENALNDARAAEEAGLRDRRDALAEALAGQQCRADGTLVLPGNLTPEGLPVLPEGAVRPDGPIEASPDAALAPPPERVEVPVDPANPSETGSLLAAIEASTVLVVAASPAGMSTGSGFVVGPGLIVTNHHVIEGAGPDGIHVTNAALGKAVPARLLKQSGPLEQVGADFALLQITETALPSFTLADPATSMKLHHVITAGFPGDVMETDSAYQALMQGELTAMPNLVVVDGTVNAEQEMMPNVDVLVHSAPLAKGNSGGPLVDFCGRVVGVNTFVRQGPLRTLNFALAADDLAAFLADTPAAQTADRASCAPSVAYAGSVSPPSAPPAADAGSPEAPQAGATAPVEE